MPHDFTEVALVWSACGGGETHTPMQWYGEHLWRATVDNVDQGTLTYKVCATDAAGSEACSSELDVTVADAPDAGPIGVDAGESPDPDRCPAADGCDGGCGCRVGDRSESGAWALVLLGWVLVLRWKNTEYRMKNEECNSAISSPFTASTLGGGGA